MTLCKTEESKQISEKKETNERLIKDRIIGDIWTLFEQVGGWYKTKRLSNFWNNNYIEYESNGDIYRNLSLDKYLIKIESYLRNIVNDLQNSDTQKIKQTLHLNLFPQKMLKKSM